MKTCEKFILKEKTFEVLQINDDECKMKFLIPQ